MDKNNRFIVDVFQKTLAVFLKKLVLDIWDEGLKKLPYGDKAIKGFMKFKNDLENLDPFPALPVEKTDPESLKLDRISFADYLKPYALSWLSL